MKYYIDTEFLEGQQKKVFGKTKPTIDLISIGIVSEDGRSYYAISKDFNLKEAWNRWQPRTGQGDRNNLLPREYWLRENVLQPIYQQLFAMYIKRLDDYVQKNVAHIRKPVVDFTYRNFKWLLKRFGKTNKQIGEEVVKIIESGNHVNCNTSQLVNDKTHEPVEFYAYFADYDWVVFCWLFGNMNSLPKGFPYYCRDLKQMLDEKVSGMDPEGFSCLYNYGKAFLSKDIDTLEKRLDLVKKCNAYPKQKNEHDALADASWNYQLDHFINAL